MGRLRVKEDNRIDCVSPGPKQKTRSVSWNSTGNKLATASTDKTAKIWNIEGREINTLSSHKAAVDRVRWHPNHAGILCTASSDRTVLLWDSRTSHHPISRISLDKQQQQQLSNQKNNVSNNSSSTSGVGEVPASVEWHPDGSALVVAGKDNNIFVYDVRQACKSVSTSSSSPSSSHGTTKSHHGNAMSGGSHSVTCIGRYPVRDTVHECHFHPRVGRHLFAATKSADGMGTVRIISPKSTTTTTSEQSSPTAGSHAKPGRKDEIFVGHTGAIFTLRFSPCGRRLATGGSDALVGLWDTADMVCTTMIGRLTKFVRCVAFSCDSKLLASCSAESVIDVADAGSGEKVGEVKAYYGADEMAWHPKHYYLAFANGDGDGDRSESRRTPKVHSSATIVKMSLS